jgi:hypothetical protein
MDNGFQAFPGDEGPCPRLNLEHLRVWQPGPAGELPHGPPAPPPKIRNPLTNPDMI